jgi:hypothetical protein
MARIRYNIGCSDEDLGANFGMCMREPLTPEPTPTIPSSSETSPDQYGNGYFAGGDGEGFTTTKYYSKIDRFNLTTEVISDPSAALSVSKVHMASVSSDSKGYVGGGHLLNLPTDVIEGLTFFNESMNVLSTTLSVRRYMLAGTSSPEKGYFGGGTVTPTTTKVDDLIFSTETSNGVVANLIEVLSYHVGIDSSTKGYFCGGNRGAVSAAIDLINFSTDAALRISATLSIARMSLMSVSAPQRGYFAGGQAAIGANPIYSKEIDGLEFSSDTAINPSATLSIARTSGAGIESVIKGYIGGGSDHPAYGTYVGGGPNPEDTGSSSFRATIDGLDFRTEAAINPSVSLSVKKNSLTGFNPK